MRATEGRLATMKPHVQTKNMLNMPIFGTVRTEHVFSQKFLRMVPQQRAVAELTYGFSSSSSS